MQYRSCWRFVALACLFCLINLFGLDRTFAQQNQAPRRQYGQSLRNRPTVSPYTSLLNNGNTTSSDNGSLSYYNIVRPQQRAQTAARSFGSELRSVESRVLTLQRPGTSLAQSTSVDAVSTGRMAPTGHRVAFGDLLGYFPGAPNSR